MNRRTFVFGLALAPLAFSRTISARPMTVTFHSGRVLTAARTGSVLVGRDHVMLGRALRAKSPSVVSRSNDNQRFWLVATFARLSTSTWLYMKIGPTVLSANSMGGTDGYFDLPRDVAESAAAGLNVPLLERTQLDAGLVYSWTFPPTAATTGAIPAILKVTNRGLSTVGFMVGGRQRGPRDNRFSFAIARDGVAQTIIDAPDFGGPGGYRELAPNASLEVTCPDLRAWHAFDKPGRYTIEAKYEGELAKDGKFPQTPTERVHLWDVAPMGQGVVVVR